MKTIRCAIYTRKSSEEGLEQGFNSLDAQREACAAYILSQASEGWTALPAIYDDGGISGGTLERPALKRLLADVEAGKIDVIVVYKVDRLSRSLFDFAKLVEAFEKVGASFVSITQSFNTTSSMGRLTLNMLLSFAQFEREVTAERIRDKIAASKAKGMWMGGVPPIGYAPDGRSLKIVEEHAELVRMIFRRYLEIGNVWRLKQQLEQDGVLVPKRTTLGGRPTGGGVFMRGQLYFLLKNPLYVGQIRHKEQIFAGLHPAIVEQDLYDAVQRRLNDNLQGSRTRERAAHVSLLAGKLVDQAGDPLVATHSTKGQVRYRYYTSRDLSEGLTKRGYRLSAASVEHPVTARIVAALARPMDLLAILGLDVEDLDQFQDRCRHLTTLSRTNRARQLLNIVDQVVVSDGGFLVRCNRVRLAELLDARLDHQKDAPLILTVEGTLQRRRGLRLVTRDGVILEPMKDTALPRLIVQARGWWAELRKGQLTISDIARREGVGKSYVSRIVRLAFLSPMVIDAALTGRLRAEASSAALKLEGGFAASWQAQQAALLPAS